jgi:hypothetical protein
MTRELTEAMISEADDRMEVELLHISEQLLEIDRNLRLYNLCKELEDRGRDIDWDYFGVEDETGQLV